VGPDREHRLSALGELAAAAAHELGTPLATIQLTAKEMMRDLEHDEILRDDAALLVEQAKRCRDILGRLSSRGEAGDAMHDRLSASALLKEAANPFFENPRGIHIGIETTSLDGETEPSLTRRPEMIYGLRNIVENAVGYAKSDVSLQADWSKDALSVYVFDNGPGFSPEILARLGEPYVNAKGGRAQTSAKSGTKTRKQTKGGLGLGFFIAKTLLEGTGGAIEFANRSWGAPPRTGACVVVHWPLSVVAARPVDNPLA